MVKHWNLKIAIPSAGHIYILKASMKIMIVANQRSRLSNESLNPPSKTTVAQVKASKPKALPDNSTKATERTNRLSVSSGALCCNPSSPDAFAAAACIWMECWPPPAAASGLAAIVPSAALLSL